MRLRIRSLVRITISTVINTQLCVDRQVLILAVIRVLVHHLL